MAELKLRSSREERKPEHVAESWARRHAHVTYPAWREFFHPSKLCYSFCTVDVLSALGGCEGRGPARVLGSRAGHVAEAF